MILRQGSASCLLTAGALSLALSITGCSQVLYTYKAPGNASLVEGVPYFLPKSVVDVDLMILKSQDAATACDDTFKKVSDAIKAQCAKIQKDDTDKAEACAKDVIDKAKKELQACKDKALATVQGYESRLSVKTTLVPDPTKPLVLDHRVNELANDEFKITVGDNGLLSSITSTAEDRTPQVVANLATTAINIVKAIAAAQGAPPVAPLLTPREAAKKKEVKEQCDLAKAIAGLQGSYHYVRETSDLIGAGSSIDLHSQGCPEVNATLKLTATRKGGDDGGTNTKIPDQPKGWFPCRAAGIVVASPQPFLIEGVLEVKLGDGTTYTLSKVERYDVLPDKRRAYLVPFRRAYFAKVVEEVSLSGGMLTSLSLKRPSPVEGFFAIPVDITKAIISLPGELIKLRYDGPTQTNELQKKLLDSEAELLKAQQALEELKKKQGTATASP